MPAPPRQPTGFGEILEQVWWRLDTALDLDMIRASALLGATEALMSGTTAIVDHHESPNAIEGSLDVIAEACAEVGVRVVCAYGVTDRHGADGARRGLEENARFLRAGGRGLVGVHAAFTCSDDTLEAAAGLAADLGVGVHIHVAEGPEDHAAGARLEALAADDWLLVHCVLLDRDAARHDRPQPAVEHEQRGRLRPAGATEPNTVVLGTDGIGADMLEEFRLAYVAHRADDVLASPDTAWAWLEPGYELVPEAADDTVEWSYDHVDSAWHVAFTPGIRAVRVVSGDGEVLLDDGRPTRVDLDEVRANAAEQAARLHAPVTLCRSVRLRSTSSTRPARIRPAATRRSAGPGLHRGSREPTKTAISTLDSRRAAT